MKSPKPLMPLLLLLGLFGLFAVAYLSPVGQVMAEGGARAIEAATVQPEANAAQSRDCQDREVEADEGYGVSHKEIRRVCQ